MIARLFMRLVRETDRRLLLNFLYSFCWQGMGSVRKFRRRAARGEVFPAFVFISVTDDCNLACQGCWVSKSVPPRSLEPAVLDRIVESSRGQGVSCFGILGGEPLCHDGIMDVMARHRDCYFILFTNGTLITDAVADRMRAAGNVSPLISVEGLERVSDERRGGRDVYRRTMRGLARCSERGLIVGVATSLCRSNLADLATAEFVDDLVGRGVHYLWYYIYRPVGPDPAPELTLSKEDIVAVRRFLVDIRTRAPILVVDAYWDQEGRALCPAATGISHHIGPGGDIEPCPPIQFAKDNVGRGGGFPKTVMESTFLEEFRDMACALTRGCVLMEFPDRLHDFVVSQGAHSSSGRAGALQELRRLRAGPSHSLAGQEIPEKHWFYRFAKRYWFFGLGAYG